MRINRYIAACTGLSRRAADEAIRQGRVKINGAIAKLGAEAPPDAAITLNGHQLEPPKQHTYLKLHKPKGYVSSHLRQGSAPTLYELLPATHRTLRLAGRLDRDSSGLVLLSDDGDFIQHLSHPSANKLKHYELTLNKPLASADAKRLTKGVELDDGLSRPQLLEVVGARVTVTLSEGRNRQLRRTFDALGYKVLRLHRTRIAQFSLGTLEAGQWEPIGKKQAIEEQPA